MGDDKVSLFFFFSLHLFKKVLYQIGIDQEFIYPITTIKNIANIIEEIFKQKFPGQLIQPFEEDIIIKGRMKNSELIMYTEK